MEKINLNNKFSLISEYWNPGIVGELNGQHVKLAKLAGTFVWHLHEHEDELFFVISGKLIIEFRDRNIELHENEFLIIPKGIEHRPVAEKEVLVMLFEPAGTVNTGNTENEMTRHTLKHI